MRSLRFLILAFVVVLAACGSSGSKTKTTATTTGSATTTAASGVAINTSQTGLGTVLVNGQGRTLYHFTKDSATTIACVDKCTVTWPPVTVPAGEQPKAGSGVTGSLTTVKRPDGTQQAAINGQPLYMYSGDTKAGDTNGQGVAGFWFAVTSSGSSAGGGAAPAATTPTTAARTNTTASGSTGGGY